MSVKDEVLHMLEANKGRYFSGATLAKELNVSRNSIWKAIKSLENEGYKILAATNKGYCLEQSNDILSKHSVGEFLKYNLDIHVYDTISSTNTVLKEMAEDGAKEGTVLVSSEQTLGRGRMGRKFVSPAGTGIYFSILLRPDIPASDSLFLTTSAAVAVAKAIEDVSDKKAKIKWVNDVFVDNKKVCGILTEATFNMETGKLNYAIVGIGINVCFPEGGFPEEIDKIATAIFDKESDSINKRSKLLAHVLNYFMDFYNSFESKSYLKEYIDRSILLGKNITVIDKDGNKTAKAISIDDECHLLVRFEDGTEKLLSSGEVSIKLD